MNKLPHARCYECPLFVNDTDAVPGYGPEDADMVVVGEAPGVNEAEEGIPFVGQSGKLLDAVLEEVNFKGSLYKTNVVACRPPGNRTPPQQAINCCAPRLRFELYKQGKKKIVSMGRTSNGFFGVPFQPGAIFKWNGFDVMPTWHPAYVLRDPTSADVFIKTLDRAAHGPFEYEPIPKPTVFWPSTVKSLEKQLSKCPDNAWVAFDIETNNTQYYDTIARKRDIVLMIQITWREDLAIVVDDRMLHEVATAEGTRAVLNEFFARVRTCAHNGMFDTVFLEAQHQIKVHLDFDTMLAFYILNENINRGLKSLASLELGMQDYEKDTIQVFLRTRNDDYSKIPKKVLGEYGAWDVVLTLRLLHIFKARLHKNGQYDTPFMEPIMKAARQFHYTKLRGMAVDTEQLEWLDTQLQAEIDTMTAEMRELAEEPELNPNSFPQMSELFYDKWGWPPAKVRKAGPRSTNKEALLQHQDRHPIVPVLQTYRRVKKMHSSYVKNITRYLGTDGRVHADFRIPGTEVGRISVANPALQTIPRAGDYYGSMIRSAFIGGKGMVLIVCDYSQAELRVFGCEANETFLIGVYKDDRDLHSEVAIRMYGENFTKEQRVQCKMFNFSYLYGGNEYSFAKDAGLDIAIAKQFVRDYNNLMPNGLAWKREQYQRLLRDGYVETIFGRRRHFPLITHSNIEEARKACVHMPIASTANDLTLLSGIEIHRLLPEFDVKRLHEIPGVVLEVHDSVIVECPRNEAKEVAEMMQTVMTNIASDIYPQIPWVADADMSKRWAEPLPHP